MTRRCYINPISGQDSKPWPNNSKKGVGLNLSLLTLSVGVRLNYPHSLYVVRRVGLFLTILKRYDTRVCVVLVLCYLKKVY